MVGVREVEEGMAMVSMAIASVAMVSMAMVSIAMVSTAMVSMAIVSRAHSRGSAARLRLRLGLQQVQPPLLPRRELEHDQLLEGLAPACQAASHLAAELVDEPCRAHLQA